MIKVVSTAPTDDFTFPLFNKLLGKVKHNYEAYYIWSNPPTEFEKFLNNLQPTKPNVVIGIKDMVDMWTDFNWWHDTAQAGSQLIINLANRHPDKNFIIFTSLENLNLEISNVPNIQVINWGGDIINQAAAYKNITPVMTKNFNSKKTYISLNRNRRPHRLVLLSYLFGKNYDHHGHITYLGQQIDTQNFDNLLDCIPWEFDERHNNARAVMLDGYSKFYNNKTLLIDDYNIYKQENDNVTNFNQSLRLKYQDSFVEIVTESSFSPPSFMLTEKTQNSIYGCNFPIILSGVGVVAHLRDIGFDVFDDIVDHSYDQINNPFDRIIAAVENNQKLLLNSDYAKQLWQENIHRFENNIAVAKNTLYTWYQDRTINQFNQINWA